MEGEILASFLRGVLAFLYGGASLKAGRAWFQLKKAGSQYGRRLLFLKLASLFAIGNCLLDFLSIITGLGATRLLLVQGWPLLWMLAVLIPTKEIVELERSVSQDKQGSMWIRGSIFWIFVSIVYFGCVFTIQIGREVTELTEKIGDKPNFYLKSPLLELFVGVSYLLISGIKIFYSQKIINQLDRTDNTPLEKVAHLIKKIKKQQIFVAGVILVAGTLNLIEAFSIISLSTSLSPPISHFLDLVSVYFSIVDDKEDGEAAISRRPDLREPLMLKSSFRFSKELSELPDPLP